MPGVLNLDCVTCEVAAAIGEKWHDQPMERFEVDVGAETIEDLQQRLELT